MNCKSCRIPQRYVFAIMGFIAMQIGFMMRMTVELTMSHMVNETIITPQVLNDPSTCPDLSIAVNNSGILVPTLETQGPFDWDNETQLSVQSTYRRAYIITQFFGGVAADANGGKKILTGSFIASGVATMALPLVAKWFGSNGVIVMRAITGLAGGTIIPVLFSMMAKWIPKNERAFVASIIFPGALIGQVAAMSLADSLIPLAGWEAVYYTCGLFGLIFAVVWVYTCYSTPNEHPRITECEKEDLNKTTDALIRSTQYDLDPLPWKAFLRCTPFWACLLAYSGRQWAFTTLTNEVPQFMKDVLRSDTNSPLFHQPYVCMWLFALLFGFTSDMLVIKGICSIKFVRKLSTSIAAIGSALCIMLIAYSGCNAVLATFLLFLGMVALGACYSGVMITVLDMNPNYAGTMIGIVDNVAFNMAVVIPMLHKLLVSDMLLYQWKMYFWLVFTIIIITLAIFLYYCQTEQVWWDDVRKNGYPTNWKKGLFATEAMIGENGETVFKPRRDQQKTDDKL